MPWINNFIFSIKSKAFSWKENLFQCLKSITALRALKGAQEMLVKQMYAYELALLTYHLEELKLYRKELTSNAINFVYNHKWKQRCVTNHFVCSMCQRKQTNDCHSVSPIKQDYFLCTSWSYRWQKHTAIQDALLAHNRWPSLCIMEHRDLHPTFLVFCVSTHSSK